MWGLGSSLALLKSTLKIWGRFASAWEWIKLISTKHQPHLCCSCDLQPHSDCINKHMQPSVRFANIPWSSELAILAIYWLLLWGEPGNHLSFDILLSSSGRRKCDTASVYTFAIRNDKRGVEKSCGVLLELLSAFSQMRKPGRNSSWQGGIQILWAIPARGVQCGHFHPFCSVLPYSQVCALSLSVWVVPGSHSGDSFFMRSCTV